LFGDQLGSAITNHGPPQEARVENPLVNLCVTMLAALLLKEPDSVAATVVCVLAILIIVLNGWPPPPNRAVSAHVGIYGTVRPRRRAGAAPGWWSTPS
jgi:hypothetical protein